MNRLFIWVLSALFALFASTAIAADKVKIMAFGDSLTAGYGLAADEAFPVRLQAALQAKGLSVEVINAGQSGDTTGAGLDRVEWALFDKPDAVILELGANDMLRGLPPEKTRDNLEKIIALFRAEQLPILMAGMLASQSFGSEYKNSFDRIFPELAESHELLFYPFFLEGVAGDMSLNQQDGIHPTAEGIDIIVANILPSVEELIGKLNQ